MLAGQINGVPGTFVIDTGASHTVVLQTYAERVGISNRREGNVWGLSFFGRVRLSTGIAARIDLGGLRISKSPVLILPDQLLRSMPPPLPATSIDAYIGSDILMRFRSTIDFAARTIVFHEPGHKDFPEEGKVIARLEPVPRSTEIIMRVNVDGVDGWFQLDTGANDYGSISAASKLIGVLREVSIAPIRAWAGGEIRVISTRLAGRMLKVNDLTNSDVQFAIEDKDARNFRAGERYIDGTLGSLFFLKNGLVIDYARMEVRRGVRTNPPASSQTEPTVSRDRVEQPQ
jgi:hypothetical protein